MMKTLLVVDGRRVEDGRALELMRSHGVEFLYMPCWKTMIKVPEEMVNEAKTLAETLEKMDETFKWKWVLSRLPDVQKQRCVLFVVYSPTKDQAYKRGSYFVKKLKLAKFRRIEKGYYWIEEYPSNLHYKHADKITITPEDADLVEMVRSCLLNHAGART
jgi:hypothetical protein